MKRITLSVLLLGLLHLSLATQAQKIGKIKSKAKTSSNNRKTDRSSRASSSSSGGGGSSSSGSGSDFAGEACFDILGGCLDIFLTSAINSSSSNSGSSSTSSYTPVETPPEKPVTVEPKKPIITEPASPPPVANNHTIPVKVKTEQNTYFQLKASYGFLPNNYSVFRPGARVRFGKKHGFGMAFDYRYNYLEEKILGEKTSYFTHDLQLLQFAPETNGDVEIRIGAGFMVDENEEFYPEFLVGFNALVDKMQWNFGSEIRLANNFSEQAPARLEWGTHVQYALVNNAKFKLYGGLRTKVANYFGEQIWSVGLGLTMRIY